MRLRASLFAKILFWSLLNLAVVGAVLAAVFSLQFRLGPDSPLFVGNRLEFVVARLGSELRRETKGVGIGLSIVKHIAEAHGGRVIVESTVGQGSRFALELPLVRGSR